MLWRQDQCYLYPSLHHNNVSALVYAHQTVAVCLNFTVIEWPVSLAIEGSQIQAYAQHALGRGDSAAAHGVLVEA